MNRYKLKENLFLDQLVPKEIWSIYYEKSIKFLDPKLVDLVFFVKDYFNTFIELNNWWTGGKREDCGFYRTEDLTDQRNFGRAAKIYFLQETNLDKIKEIIRFNYDIFKKVGLTAMKEQSEDYLFLSTEWTHKDRLIEF